MAFQNKRDLGTISSATFGTFLSQHLVLGELLTGVVDGSNATFTTAFNVLGSSIDVFIGTILQGAGVDYTFTAPNTITFVIAPDPTSYPTVDYIR